MNTAEIQIDTGVGEWANTAAAQTGDRTEKLAKIYEIQADTGVGKLAKTAAIQVEAGAGEWANIAAAQTDVRVGG